MYVSIENKVLSSQNKTSKRSIKPFNYDRVSLLWKKEENLQYMAYLQENQELFVSERLTRGKKVFLQISKRIPTKSADQCRSHHQKMMKTHKSIPGIIAYLQEKYLSEASNPQDLQEQQSREQDLIRGASSEQVITPSDFEGGFPSSDSIWSFIDKSCWVGDSQEELAI